MDFLTQLRCDHFTDPFHRRRNQGGQMCTGPWAGCTVPPRHPSWSCNWQPDLLSQKFLLCLRLLCCLLVSLLLSFPTCEMGSGDRVS